MCEFGVSIMLARFWFVVLPLIMVLAQVSLIPEVRGDGKKRPELLSGDPTKAQIDAVRKEWADFYGVPLEYSEDLGKGVKLEMVFIPPGTFWMGAAEGEIDDLVKRLKKFSRNYFKDELPQHKVTISEGFYLGKYEVTQSQYEALIGHNPSRFDTAATRVEGRDLDTRRFPVESVNWYGAQKYTDQLTKQGESNKKVRMYRLPSEAEWEYACRGGQCSKENSPFHFENGPQRTLSSTQANFDGDYPSGGAYGKVKGPYLKRTCEVGTYNPNRFGIHDMHGNVSEWCNDYYDEYYYANSPETDPEGPKSERIWRVIRGSCWPTDDSWSRASYRRHTIVEPTSRAPQTGFRVLATLVSSKK